MGGLKSCEYYVNVVKYNVYSNGCILIVVRCFYLGGMLDAGL